MPFQKSSLGRAGWLGRAVLLVGLLLGSVSTARLAAQDFRVDNRVFVDQEKTPSSQSTTIFRDGDIFDFLEQPEEFLIFLESRQEFVLLNVARRVRTDIPGARVVEFTDAMRQRAEKQDKPFLQFMANPLLEQEVDNNTGALTFRSPWITYRVLPAAADPAVARRYREFSDWYARIGPILQPGALLPLARMQVNLQLQRRGVVPREVSLTVTPARGMPEHETHVRSEHRLVERLTAADEARVAQARQMMAIFTQVDLREYRQPGQ